MTNNRTQGWAATRPFPVAGVRQDAADALFQTQHGCNSLAALCRERVSVAGDGEATLRRLLGALQDAANGAETLRHAMSDRCAVWMDEMEGANVSGYEEGA